MAVKESRKLERVFKGVANHWRIDILFLIKKSPQISLFRIADKLNANRKTVSEHTWRLYKAGLINKNYKGRQVVHTLSPYGEKVTQILKNF
ncbi:MAG: winged helix-turn-helix domain-containing protein [candidate division Zixibacteria bacterium]|nr:winged helix-turn-helix domain-containing protein [candidate division Zixibacteria bacterium]